MTDLTMSVDAAKVVLGLIFAVYVFLTFYIEGIGKVLMLIAVASVTITGLVYEGGLH